MRLYYIASQNETFFSLEMQKRAACTSPTYSSSHVVLKNIVYGNGVSMASSVPQRQRKE